MSTSVRRRLAMVALAAGLLGGGALAANTALLAPTADGGMPTVGPGGPIRSLPTITIVTKTIKTVAPAP